MKVYLILGRVVDRITQRGVKGLLVESWDKDMLVSDLVGSTTTGDAGTFQIQFDESYFKELFLDRQPDLFFKVYKKDRFLKSTEDSVIWNVEAGETPVTIEIDYKEDNMPNEKELQIPVEIPWKLASTTQVLKESGPDDTSVSVFYYEPDIESLETEYPDERLIYLKFNVSVSPYQPDEASFGKFARDLLEGGLPVWQMLLDLKVQQATSSAGEIRPYFHAAAPTHRNMIETGIIGADAFEGEASGLAIGKSGSQLHETLSSHVTTKTTSGGGFLNLGILGGGISARKTSTAVDSERMVDQHLETTTREAAQERRELLSHMSNVENILTLLTAKHVGSPYLRFSLFPRPLHVLSLDPSDPNLWYNQLLHRRSSGIEGMQEFFAVLSVPKTTEGFTMNATLRRVCVLDNPPSPPDVSWREYNLEMWFKVRDYLRRIYPTGVPVEELDVDLDLDSEEFRRPIIRDWTPGVPDELGYVEGGRDVVVSVSSLGWTPSLVRLKAYKRVEEVVLQMYEEDLTRSPLERGIVLDQTIELDTNFSLEGGDNGIEVIGHSTRTLPAVEVYFKPNVQPTPPHMRRYRGFAPVPYRHVHTVTSWNLLEEQLAKHLRNLKTYPGAPISPSSPRVLQHLLARWEGLAPEDLRNLPLSEVSSMLKLSKAQTRLLTEAGVNDLRGIAQGINAAPKIRELNTELEKIAALLPKEEAEKLKPVELPIPTEKANDIRQQISKAFQPVLPDNEP